VQTDFIALYRGQTVAEARLLALSADPEIVGRFVRELAGESDERDDERSQPLQLVLGGDEE
jgi:hypothetical protein